MPDDVRLSPQTLVVLAALLQAPSEWRYGYDLSQETGLKSGTLYPILARLAERKWLDTRWEHAEENGKPRHMYRLSTEGRYGARASIARNPGRLKSLRPAYRTKG
jgi:PadR family transcriptional regulator, regulatory protein PadR